MNTLPNDVIIYMALSLDLPEILMYCKTSKKYNKLICDNPLFWSQKIFRDYGINYYHSDSKDRYRYIRKKMKNPKKAVYNGAMLGDVDLIKAAKKYGVNIRESSDLPLRIASEHGHIDVVKYLIENGADIHSSDDAAIRWAAYSGRFDIVKYLAEIGANIHTQDDYVIKVAGVKGYVDIVKYLQNK